MPGTGYSTDRIVFSDMNSMGGGSFSWEKYMNVTFRLANRTVEPSTEIVSFADTFIRNMTRLLEKYENELRRVARVKARRLTWISNITGFYKTTSFG